MTFVRYSYYTISFVKNHKKFQKPWCIDLKKKWHNLPHLGDRGAAFFAVGTSGLKKWTLLLEGRGLECGLGFKKCLPKKEKDQKWFLQTKNIRNGKYLKLYTAVTSPWGPQIWHRVIRCDEGLFFVWRVWALTHNMSRVNTWVYNNLTWVPIL